MRLFFAIPVDFPSWIGLPVKIKVITLDFRLSAKTFNFTDGHKFKPTLTLANNQLRYFVPQQWKPVKDRSVISKQLTPRQSDAH